MVLLALDVGEKKIGLAKTDPLGVGVWPLPIFWRQSLEFDFQFLTNLIREHAITGLVVGLPCLADATEGDQARKVRRFIQSLQRFLKQQGETVGCEWINERLTTWEARQHLQGMKRREKKKRIDSVAACLMLEEYLNNRMPSQALEGGES